MTLQSSIIPHSFELPAGTAEGIISQGRFFNRKKGETLTIARDDFNVNGSYMAYSLRLSILPDNWISVRWSFASASFDLQWVNPLWDMLVLSADRPPNLRGIGANPIAASNLGSDAARE